VTIPPEKFLKKLEELEQAIDQSKKDGNPIDLYEKRKMIKSIILDLHKDEKTRIRNEFKQKFDEYRKNPANPKIKFEEFCLNKEKEMRGFKFDRNNEIRPLLDFISNGKLFALPRSLQDKNELAVQDKLRTLEIELEDKNSVKSGDSATSLTQFIDGLRKEYPVHNDDRTKNGIYGEFIHEFERENGGTYFLNGNYQDAQRYDLLQQKINPTDEKISAETFANRIRSELTKFYPEQVDELLTDITHIANQHGLLLIPEFVKDAELVPSYKKENEEEAVLSVLPNSDRIFNIIITDKKIALECFISTSEFNVTTPMKENLKLNSSLILKMTFSFDNSKISYKVKSESRTMITDDIFEKIPKERATEIARNIEDDEGIMPVASGASRSEDVS
jgi:hypothetical protein